MGAKTDFITFYSYKGGVGRTSALVNSAILRANEGNKVVIMDFDLEAPGVGSYLSSLDNNFNDSKPGILDYLNVYLEQGQILSLENDLAYDLSGILNKANGGSLWVIGAGNTKDKNYSRKLDEIRWGRIFKEKQGDLLLKNLKRQIEKEFDADFVFIDSRTGITETGGVCTKYLADKIVVLSSLNNQNIKGTSAVLADLKNSVKEFILVASNVPVGLPSNDGSLLIERFEEFEKSFNKKPDVVIYNYPALSLSENLPVEMSSAVFDDQKFFLLDNDPLHQSYKLLSDKINSISKENYLHIVEDACDDLFLYETEDTLQNFENLLEFYPNRKFSKIIQSFDKYLGIFKKDKVNVSSLDAQEFDKFIFEAESASNKVIRRALAAFKRTISIYIMRSKEIELDDTITTFLRDKRIIEVMVLREMGKNNFQWALKMLSDLVNKESPNPNNLFNFAWCKKQLGEKAVTDFKVFLNSTKIVSPERLSPTTQVNYYTCLGLAHLEVGEVNRAKSNFNIALDKIVKLEDEEVFSPFTYNEQNKEEIKDNILNILNSQRGKDEF